MRVIKVEVQKEDKTIAKEFKVPARYQDKRKAEKDIKDWIKSLDEAPKKERPLEVLVPLRIDERTVYWIRESRFLKNKIAKKILKSAKQLKSYLAEYKSKFDFEIQNNLITLSHPNYYVSNTELYRQPE
jgi:hypothetical protein